MATQNFRPELIEKYQQEYEKNPKSQVFAPLAEAYRRMGMIDMAYQVARQGVHDHPQFANGLVTFARILRDMKRPDEALEQLETAVQFAPDHLQAQLLLGETLLEKRRPKEALKAFKMVLFLDSRHERALTAVRKWEFLTADEYDPELFDIEPEVTPAVVPAEDAVFDFSSGDATSTTGLTPDREFRQKRELDRALSLADAFTIRNDVERAIELLQKAKAQLGPLPEINNRLAILAQRLVQSQEQEPEPEQVQEPNTDPTQKLGPAKVESKRAAPQPPRIDELKKRNERARLRVRHLQILLQRINDRRLDVKLS